MTFAAFAPSPLGKVGFHMLAGWPQGSEAIDGRRGRVPAGEVGPMQVHQGDEVPRVRSGQILIRCRDQRRTWREGAPVVVAPGVAHGFRAVTETVPGVVPRPTLARSIRVSAMAARPNLLSRIGAAGARGRPPGPGSGRGEGL